LRSSLRHVFAEKEVTLVIGYKKIEKVRGDRIADSRISGPVPSEYWGGVVTHALKFLWSKTSESFS